MRCLPPTLSRPAFCVLLIGSFTLLPGCAGLNDALTTVNDALSGECAGATVVGAGAGGLAGWFVGDKVIPNASKGVNTALIVGAGVLGAVAAHQACESAKAQQRELEMEFASAQAELDSLRAARGEPAPLVSPATPTVEVVQVESEEQGQPSPVMTRIELGSDVLAYESGRADLPTVAPVYLRPIARTIYDDPTQQIVVVGHTDDVGDASSNLTLSERRAQSIADFLIAQGISPDRVQAVGAGEHKPRSDNDTPEGRALNRRVEVFVVHSA